MATLNYRDPVTHTWMPLLVGAQGLVPTAIKTASYTASVNDLVRVNVSGGAFAVNLPPAPTNGSTVGVMVDTGHLSNLCTITCGGTDHFQRTTGATTKPCNVQDQLWVGEYQSGVWYTIVDIVRSFMDGSGTTLDTATAGVAKINVNATQSFDAVRFTTGVQLMSARLCTTAALPANTYNPGASGVGATLTANANAQLPDIDFVTPAVGNVLLVQNEATAANNGIYTVTQRGDATHPYILTRHSAADYSEGLLVMIAEGRAMAGTLMRCRQVNPTLGTTSITFQGAPRAQVTPGDVFSGTNRDRLRFYGEFTELGAPITANGPIPGTGWSVNVSGTGAQASQTGGSEVLPGTIDMATGTTTGGYCTVGGPVSVIFQAAQRWAMYGRAKIPTLSDGTNTFMCRMGAQAGLIIAAAAPAAGLYFEANGPTTANWQCVARHASVETRVDSGVAMVTGWRQFAIVYDENTQTALFYIGAVLVGSITTNLPVGDSILAGGFIVKSVGATSRDFVIDRLDFDLYDTRALLPLLP